MRSEKITVDLVHNILWSKYKGEVFSKIHEASSDIDFSFFQIAKTDAQRQNLTKVDLSYHRYPFLLLFDKSYGEIPKYKLIFKLYKLVASSKSELVLLPGYHTLEYWAMLLACILTGKKRAVFVDSTRADQPISRIKDLFKRIFFSLCDGFFCYGRRSKEYLEELGVPAHKIYYRCQAAALPHDYNAVEVLRNRVNFNSTRSAPIFLYVGRLSSEKALDVLINAFHAVKRLHPNSRLKLAGSGPCAVQLLDLVESLSIQDSVDFLGSKDADDLQQLYLEATCLILPSRSEPWGLVVNEALSYGCPAIVSDKCGCVPELIKEGETGYCFRSGDVKDLAGKMDILISEDASLNKYASNCINLISRYLPKDAAQQIIGGIKNIVNVQENK